MSADIDESQLLKAIQNLKIPPAPHVLDKLHRELQKDEPVLGDMANILAQDIALSGLVLRSVNSPFFGLRTKATSIQHATSLLGMRNVVNIVAGLALRRAFEQEGSENPPNYWDSPFNVAIAATVIARTVFYPSPDEAYMLGLFHNAGHSLLVQHYPEYKEFMIANLNDASGSIAQMEDHWYGTNHTIPGYFLARSWGLDRKIANVIRDHHNVKERFAGRRMAGDEELTLLAILKMAEHIDKQIWGYNPDYEWLEIKDLILDFVGFNEQDFTELHHDIVDNAIRG